MKNIFLFCFIILLTACEYNKKYKGYDGEDKSDLIITDHISNASVCTFAEDGFGNIWLGTSRGVNKLVGNTVVQYFNTQDSLCLADNQIRKIFNDSQNRLWIATTNGICIYTEQDNFKTIPNESASTNVIDIIENKDGDIFINMVHQLCKYDEKEKKFKVVVSNFKKTDAYINNFHTDPQGDIWSVNANYACCFSSKDWTEKYCFDLGSYIQASLLRDNGDLWLVVRNKIVVIDTKNASIKNTENELPNDEQLSKYYIKGIFPYLDNQVILNTEKGLCIYNISDKSFIYQWDNTFPFEIPNVEIRTMFIDSQKNLWLGSSDQGYFLVKRYESEFNNNNYLRSSLDRKSITSIAKDLDNNIWLVTSYDGVYVYDRQQNNLDRIKTNHFLEKDFAWLKKIVRVFTDSQNNIWLITTYNKILKCRFKKGELDLIDTYHLPTMIFEMEEDKWGNIYATGYNNYLYTLRRGSNTFAPTQLYSDNFSYTTGLLAMSSGNLMIASFNNDLRILNTLTNDISSIKLKHLIKHSVLLPTCLHEDSNNKIWLGTLVNGVFYIDPHTGEAEHLEGISCSDISSINEDQQGIIWIATQNGLCKYDRTNKKFTTFYGGDGLGGSQFNERSSITYPDGSLLFGGTHGVTIFNPVDISHKRTIPIFFENLLVHNRLIRPGNGEPIDKHLNYKPKIQLHHDENSFSISFSALDYSSSSKIQYFYKMEGFDDYWVNSKESKTAHYSNLPVGNYTFKVKITSTNNAIVETENSIEVEVTPAPWLSPWAYCIYVIIALLIVFFIFRTVKQIAISKLAARKAREEKEHEEHINKMNASYFANISHEFRTPLTMMVGPVTQLVESESFAGKEKRMIQILQRSIMRLLKLVDQQLDFNKLENDSLPLVVSKTDVISTITDQIEIFQFNLENKKIEFRTRGLEGIFIVWLDQDKFVKILTNLMANALKFTSNGGSIDLEFDVISNLEAADIFDLNDNEKQLQYIKISIADSGPGITPGKEQKIFERFYQDDYGKDVYNWGTGIGLYFSQKLIDLHHGHIKAENKINGGAIFTFILPVNDEVYPASERLDKGKKLNQHFVKNNTILEILEDSQIKSERPTLLIVDDDTEVIYYLQLLLEKYYNLICKFDADSALDALDSNRIDLVLSDVIMPKISGYELCKTIKNNIQLCHIPIILVTSKYGVESQVEGLNVGADAYVTKPFDPVYLLALIDTTLKNREKIKNLLSSNTKTEEISEDVLSSHDALFMSELYGLMESELSNVELNISEMTGRMNVSRTKLYYKIKGLTGENPNVFFKTYKLNRAAQLLKEGKYNISEVADMTGFSTLSHFSSSFKKHFGISPSDYIK